MGAMVHSFSTVQRPCTTIGSASQKHHGCLHHQAPPLLVTASFNLRYPELHVTKRYPVNSPLLRQDPDLPLFFVNEVPRTCFHEHAGHGCSSYSNRGQKALYYVSGGPFHGYLRYFFSARAASVHVQGTMVTAPTESLQILIDRWLPLTTPAMW
jgi:hypothetical protein